jgi:hypothetical protein
LLKFELTGQYVGENGYMQEKPEDGNPLIFINQKPTDQTPTAMLQITEAKQNGKFLAVDLGTNYGTTVERVEFRDRSDSVGGFQLGHFILRIGDKPICQNKGTFNKLSNACECVNGYSGITCEIKKENQNDINLLSLTEALNKIARLTDELVVCRATQEKPMFKKQTAPIKKKSTCVIM